MSQETSPRSPGLHAQEIALSDPIGAIVRHGEEAQQRADARYETAIDHAHWMGAAVPPDYVRVRREYENVAQDVIRVTEDKAAIILGIAFKHAVARYVWTAPAGALLAITLTLLTAEFHDWLNISAATWQAAFIILDALTAVLTLILTAKALRAPSQKRLLTDTIKQLGGRADPR